MPIAEGGFVGLDIFYVLSGFLITGLILKEIDRKGKVSIRDFYARRAKRLLPLSAFVLVVIAVASLFIFSTVRQVEVGGDIFAAALYFVNWRFISQEVDYFAFDEGLLSPVQHYWSLSVEEQFYVVWPLLLTALAAFAFRHRRRARGVMLAVLIPLTVASLAYSITYTASSPESAYFSTLTRGWELSIGGVLALVLPRGVRMPGWLSTSLTGGGILAISIAALLLREVDPYPGWRALIPVLGTIAVIVGGAAIGRGLAVRFLATSPLQYLGKISYAWYLWHWPFVVFAVALWGHLSWEWLVVITLAAWIPTEISHRLIEEPFRRSEFLNLRPKRALAVGAVCTLATVGVGLGISQNRFSIDSLTQQEVAGAAVINSNFTPQEKVGQIKPNPLEARDDRGVAFAEGCLVKGPVFDSGECGFGKSGSDHQVVLLGDSHALQYSPAMINIADKNGWHLTVLTRGNCLIADIDYRENCDKWRRNTLKRVEDQKPDMIVISTSTLDRFRAKPDGEELSRNDSQPYLVDGLVEVIKRLRATGAKIVIIRDQARAPFLPHECVAEHADKLRECAFEPKRREGWSFDRDAAERTGVKLIDPMPLLCRNEICPSVIGDALVYRDTYHLSATFSKTMAPWLEKRLPKLPKGTKTASGS